MTAIPSGAPGSPKRTTSTSPSPTSSGSGSSPLAETARTVGAVAASAFRHADATFAPGSPFPVSAEWAAAHVSSTSSASSSSSSSRSSSRSDSTSSADDDSTASTRSSSRSSAASPLSSVPDEEVIVAGRAAPDATGGMTITQKPMSKFEMHVSRLSAGGLEFEHQKKINDGRIETCFKGLVNIFGSNLEDLDAKDPKDAVTINCSRQTIAIQKDGVEVAVLELKNEAEVKKYLKEELHIPDDKIQGKWEEIDRYVTVLKDAVIREFRLDASRMPTIYLGSRGAANFPKGLDVHTFLPKDASKLHKVQIALNDLYGGQQFAAHKFEADYQAIAVEVGEKLEQTADFIEKLQSKAEARLKQLEEEKRDKLGKTSATKASLMGIPDLQVLDQQISEIQAFIEQVKQIDLFAVGVSCVTAKIVEKRQKDYLEKKQKDGDTRTLEEIKKDKEVQKELKKIEQDTLFESGKAVSAYVDVLEHNKRYWIAKKLFTTKPKGKKYAADAVGLYFARAEGCKSHACAEFRRALGVGVPAGTCLEEQLFVDAMSKPEERSLEKYTNLFPSQTILSLGNKEAISKAFPIPPTPPTP